MRLNASPNPVISNIEISGGTVTTYNNDSCDQYFDGEESKRNSNFCSGKGIFGKSFLLIFISFAIIITCTIVVNTSLNTGEDRGLSVLLLLCIPSFIVTLVCALIGGFSINACKVCSILYSISEGIFLGTLTGILDYVYPGIGLAAVVCTFGVTFTMAFLYFARILKPGEKMKKFIISTLVGMVLISAVAGISSLCGYYTLSYLFFGEGSVLGWIVSILMVIVSALSLLIDFEYADQLARAEVDKKYEWKAAFGLAVSVLYLYLRILELLLRLMASSKKK